MDSFPRVRSVKPLRNKRLLVVFHNGTKKVYDCAPLLKSEVFRPLADEMLFRAVRSDPGGYGISWNEEIDLSEAELWVHGLPVASRAEQYDSDKTI